MTIPFFQVDAFTSKPFGGNPAAVCLLDNWPADELLGSIAAENNLSETAFLVPSRTREADYELRWFTPEIEVDLCGHATLASGHVALRHLRPDAEAVSFSTRSGVLRVHREATGSLRMDLPADPREAGHEPAIAAILGNEPLALLGGSTWIAVLPSASEVKSLDPDIGQVAALQVPYLNVTGPGDPDSGVDFVSRFFAPGAGIDEDPVTGSAHCALTPYWAGRLGRSRLRARQVSARGGEVDCELVGERVLLRGTCAEVIEGHLTLSPL